MLRSDPEVNLPSILIVEDDFEIAATIAELLTGSGHVTRTACNGVEGLRQIGAAAPDLILLDVEMPILDGPGMAHALATERAGKTPIPIVLVSAARDIEMVARRVGTPHYLKKPFSLDRLTKLIDGVLGTRARR